MEAHRPHPLLRVALIPLDPEVSLPDFHKFPECLTRIHCFCVPITLLHSHLTGASEWQKHYTAREKRRTSFLADCSATAEVICIIREIIRDLSKIHDKINEILQNVT